MGLLKLTVVRALPTRIALSLPQRMFSSLEDDAVIVYYVSTPPYSKCERVSGRKWEISDVLESFLKW